MRAAMTRRQVLATTGLVGLGAFLTGCSGNGSGSDATPLPSPGTSPRTSGRWPGHQTGAVIVSMSAQDADRDGSGQEDFTERSAEITDNGALAPVGGRRNFVKWNAEQAESAFVRENIAAGRYTWLSTKPPRTAGATAVEQWEAVAAGAYDREIRAMARRWAGYAAPLIMTPHHEPSNERSPGVSLERRGAAWAAWYNHIWDVVDQETGHDNVALVPIMGDWLWNDANEKDKPEPFLPASTLTRVNEKAFLGIDLYQNAGGLGYDERLGAVLDWCAGVTKDVSDLMVGVGETGACLAVDARPDTWLADQWAWCVDNTDRIGILSYFNSVQNSKPGYDWTLAEPGQTEIDGVPSKLSVFRDMLDSSVAATLATQ